MMGRPKWLSWDKIQECILIVLLIPAWLVYEVFLWTRVWLRVGFRWCRRRYDKLVYEPRRTLLTPKEIQRRINAREERHEVRPLPAMRPRALTLGAQTEKPDVSIFAVAGGEKRKKKKRRSVEEVKQSTTDQLKSSDFWKLPFEIRELIWKYAVGQNHIHIVRARRRLCNVFCPHNDPMDPEHSHLCTLSRDRLGLYVPTAWPKDVLPLSLLLSCRQIYSETVDFLYSRNTFSFDDLSTLNIFFTNLLPHRRRLISSVHIAFNYYLPLPRRYHLYIRGPMDEQDERTKAWQAACSASLQHLRDLPKLDSLMITRPLGGFLLGVRSHQVPTDEASLYMTGFFNGIRSVKVINDFKIFWFTDSSYLNVPEVSTCEWVPLPKRQSVELLAFFTPVHVRCLHCRTDTIIRKGVKGFAESSLTTVNGEYLTGPTVSNEPKATHYWTYHTFCGGWIEYQFDWVEERWSVTQGAVEISDEEAEAHLLEHGERYPKMLSPHEALQGLQTKKHPMNPQWQMTMGRYMDLPTKATFYWHHGWAKTRGLKEPWEFI